MYDSYTKFQVKILEIQLMLAGAELSDYDRQQNRVRSADGEWAKSPQTSNPTIDTDIQTFDRQLKSLQQDAARIEKMQANTYKAFDVDVKELGSGFMTGFGQPDIFQALIFDAAKNSLGISAEEVKKVASELQQNPEQAQKIIAKYVEKLQTTPQANLSSLVLTKYLQHKNNLASCTQAGSSLLEKDIHEQLGCLNSFSMEVTMKLAPYVGVAIVPELLGAGVATGALEAMLVRVALRAPQNIVIGEGLQRAGKVIEESSTPEVATGIAAGLLVGGALRETELALKQNPEAMKAVNDYYQKLQTSVAKVDSFAIELNKAIETTGNQPIDLQEVYKNLSPASQDIFKQLTK